MVKENTFVRVNFHPPKRDLSIGDRINKTEIRELTNRRLRTVRTEEHKLVESPDGETEVYDVGKGSSDDTTSSNEIRQRLIEIVKREELSLEFAD